MDADASALSPPKGVFLMKEKPSIEHIADVYKYFMRLKPAVKELPIKVYPLPAGAIIQRSRGK